MTDHPLCTRHRQPQIAKKNGGYTGRCPECMRQDNRRKSMARRGKPNPNEICIDFTLYPNFLAFVKERADANVRSVSQQILYMIAMAMKSAAAGYKAKGL